MSKTLSELSSDLKEYLFEMNAGPYNSGGFKKYRYNNLKVEILDPRLNRVPQVKITIGISEAIFELINGERIAGSLGPDDRFANRWILRENVMAELKDAYLRAEKQVGKAKGAE